jgi:hypothetical protein
MYAVQVSDEYEDGVVLLPPNGALGGLVAVELKTHQDVEVRLKEA